MKNIMMFALLSVGVCVAGENMQHNAVGVPLQVPVVAAMAIAVAHGNNGQVHLPKPKHNEQPLEKRKNQNDFNCPRSQKKNYSVHHRHGYSGRK